MLKVLAVFFFFFFNETMPDVPLSTLFLCRQLHIHCRDMRHFTEYWSKCQSIPLRTNSLYDRRLVYRALRLRHRPLPRQRVQRLLVFFVCLHVCLFAIVVESRHLKKEKKNNSTYHQSPHRVPSQSECSVTALGRQAKWILFILWELFQCQTPVLSVFSDAESWSVLYEKWK